MDFWLGRVWHEARIMLLMMAMPVVLFKKLYSIDWYKKTLQQWIEDSLTAQTNNVLEVGCAAGGLSEYLAEQGRRVTGIDASPKMIAATKQCQHRVDYSVGDVNNLRFDDNIFDAVVSASVLNIVPDQQVALAEMARVCRPGGVVSILAPKKGFSNDAFRVLMHSLNIRGFSAAALNVWNRRGRKLSKKEIVALFHKLGLTPIAVSDYLNGMVFSVIAVKPA